MKSPPTRTVFILTVMTFIPSCSVYDVRQLIAPADTALLIRQAGQQHDLSLVVATEPTTQLNGVRVDPKQLPVTASNSLAIKKAGDNAALDALPLPDIQRDQAQKILIHYLADIEANPERIEQRIAKAEQLAQRFSDDALTQSLFQRLSRYSDWQAVNTIIDNAGIDFVSLNGWQPESPFIRTRRALLPPVADNEHVIFADQRLVMLMTNTAAVSLHIDSRLEDVPFLPESPTVLSYQLDDQPSQQITLIDKADWQRVTLAMPAGEHAVRLYQQQPVGNQYVKLRFDDHLSNLAVAQERPYFISTVQTPLAFYSQGPAIVRIDELNDGVITYRYQDVPEGWHKISVPPSTGKPRSLLRVSQRVAILQPKAARNRITPRPLTPVAPPETLLTPLVAVDNAIAAVKPDKVALRDAFSLGQQEDGTLSAGVDFVRRNNKQESGASLPEEQFAQYRMNARYFDEPRDSYWNTQGAFRVREFGDPTLGLNESVYYNPDWLPFSVRSTAKVFAQIPEDEWDALAQWDLTLAQAYQLHPKTRLIPSITFFARTMSHAPNVLDNLAGLNTTDPKFIVNMIAKLTNIPVANFLAELSHLSLSAKERALLASTSTQPSIKHALDYIQAQNPDFLPKVVATSNQKAQAIDQDIYTPYKADHLAGFSPALTLEHRPWLDTVWSVKIAEQTNEDFNPSLPDNYSTEAHWRQLLGHIGVDASYRSAFYQPDDYSWRLNQAYVLPQNRRHAQERSYAELELNWQHWTRHQNRFEVSAQYSYDMQRNAHLGMLSFTYHVGEGRGLRDFAPNEIDFRDNRQRQIANEHNNLMRDVNDALQ